MMPYAMVGQQNGASAHTRVSSVQSGTWAGLQRWVSFVHSCTLTLVFRQPPQMGSMVMTQPGLLYSQPGIRQANPFGANPGAQVSQL